MKIAYVTLGGTPYERNETIEEGSVEEIEKRLEREGYRKIYDEYGPEIYYEKEVDGTVHIVYGEK